VGQVGELVLDKDDKQQGSGTVSGGRSWVDFHDQNSRSTSRTPLLFGSKFSSDRGNRLLGTFEAVSCLLF
jgi:hypothetical protein